MKKIGFSAIFAMISMATMANGDLVTTAVTLENDKEIAEAADSAVWKFPGSVGINANQAYFNEYSTEGSGASVSIDAYLNLNANYKKNKSMWDNALSAKYGMIYSTEFTGEDKIRKNMDEFIINTKYGYKISKAWYVSAFANMETQFVKGYEYLKNVENQDSASMISNFFAPGYVKVSVGMECIPNKYVSIFLSPITARFSFCRLNELGDRYGMKLVSEALYDENNKLLREAEFEHSRVELGAYGKIKTEFDITKSLHFMSSLEGFYAYNKAVEDLTDSYIDFCAIQNPDGKLDFVFDESAFDVTNNKYESVNGWYIKWKLEMLMKVSKYVNVSLKTQLKYDNAEKKTVEGENYGLPKANLQFWETISLGVAYSF